MGFQDKVEDYDSSWDLNETEEGNLPEDEDAFDRKYREWKKRGWSSWLEKNLVFPFTAKRMEDDDDVYFTKVAKRNPFRLGHTMEVLGIEDEMYGIIVEVREGREKGYVPLADLEVTSRDDKNFWPVREYVVWFANR